VYPEVDMGHIDETFKEPRLLYWNRGDGQFFDMSSPSGQAISANHSSRGLAVGDLDNDGEEEIVIDNLGEAPSWLKNFGPRLWNSILIRLVTPTGREAIGARVTLTSDGHRQVDEIHSCGSFMSQNDTRLHFGLGKGKVADLSIRWVDGKTEKIPAIDAGQVVTIQEGKGIIQKKHCTSL
jgi:hypothetical protein